MTTPPPRPTVMKTPPVAVPAAATAPLSSNASRPPAYVPRHAPTAPSSTIPVRTPRAIVPRIFMYAGEKFGKTSLAAFAPDPIILMCRDNGYDTLLSAGAVPAVRAVEIESFPVLIGMCRAIAQNPDGAKTLVIDGITGAERMCHEHVCSTKFNNKWGDDGFMAYHKGYSLSASEWLLFLAVLDEVRDAGVTVLMLGHARTKKVENPMGANYDRFEPDVTPQIWGPTAKWFDAILFGKFHTVVNVARRDAMKLLAEQSGKAIGGTQRVLFCSPHDAWVAGNRYQMESEIWLAGGPESMWGAVMDQIRKPAAV